MSTIIDELRALEGIEVLSGPGPAVTARTRSRWIHMVPSRGSLRLHFGNEDDTELPAQLRVQVGGEAGVRDQVAAFLLGTPTA